MLKIFRPQAQKQLRCVLSYCCNFSDNASGKRKPSGPGKTSDNDGISSDNAEKSLRSAIDKNDLLPVRDKNDTNSEKLRSFYTEDSNIDLLKWVQQPIDLRPKAIKNWWLKRKEKKNTALQQYIPERYNILGPELACAHFIVGRGGAVKFHNENNWIKADEGEYQLPERYQKGMYLQAIDCTDVKLTYEGLENLRGLKNVEWLSLNGCIYMDDFCIDTISNIFSHSVHYLDLRNCFEITERGLGALYKMDQLKILYLDDMLKDTRYELTCLLLEELNPGLLVKSDVINFEIK